MQLMKFYDSNNARWMSRKYCQWRLRYWKLWNKPCVQKSGASWPVDRLWAHRRVCSHVQYLNMVWSSSNVWSCWRLLIFKKVLSSDGYHPYTLILWKCWEASSISPWTAEEKEYLSILARFLWHSNSTLTGYNANLTRLSTLSNVGVHHITLSRNCIVLITFRKDGLFIFHHTPRYLSSCLELVRSDWVCNKKLYFQNIKFFYIQSHDMDCQEPYASTPSKTILKVECLYYLTPHRAMTFWSTNIIGYSCWTRS